VFPLTMGRAGMPAFVLRGRGPRWAKGARGGGREAGRFPTISGRLVLNLVLRIFGDAGFVVLLCGGVFQDQIEVAGACLTDAGNPPRFI
jgi:hypothetical protein